MLGPSYSDNTTTDCFFFFNLGSETASDAGKIVNVKDHRRDQEG